MPQRLVILNGAPGSGKSTLAAILKDRLGAVDIDFGSLRNFHLNEEWSNQSPQELAVSFANLVDVIRNYLASHFSLLVVHDLPNGKEMELYDMFAEYSTLVTLTAKPDVIRRRVALRTSGFRNVDWALEWNEQRLAVPLHDRELRIDTTDEDPEVAAAALMQLLEQGK